MKSRVELKAELYEAQDGKCFYCGESITLESATLDHFYPKKLKQQPGGSQAQMTRLDKNSVCACRSCNAAKGHRLPTTDEVTRFFMTFRVMPRLFKSQGVST